MTTSATDAVLQSGVPAGGHYVHRLVRVCPVCGVEHMKRKQKNVNPRCFKCQKRINQKSYEIRNTEKRKASQAKYREENRAAINLRSRECKRIWMAEWRKANPTAAITRERAFTQKHHGRLLQRQRAERERLSDTYVKEQLARYSILRPSEIPQPLVELKREHLKLKRLCKKSRTSAN
ncbi:MAG: hypothetical protein ACOYNN_04100 [Terrimicrobiaceae bacterium]